MRARVASIVTSPERSLGASIKLPNFRGAINICCDHSEATRASFRSGAFACILFKRWQLSTDHGICQDAIPSAQLPLNRICNYSLGSYLKHQLRIVLSCFTPSILYSVKPWLDPTVSTESVELWNSAGSTAASKLAWGDSLNLHLGVFDQTSTDRLLCFIVVLEFVCSCLVCSRLVCLCKYRPHGPNDSLNAFVLLAFSKLLLFSSCISA